MFLQEIKLFNFRNHGESSFSFHSKISCFVGRNGAGKTNVLDAIHYLCLTKSNLFTDDKLNVKHGNDFFRLEGSFIQNEQLQKVVCKYVGARKKEFTNNDVPYTKLSEHIGKIPCIMICPTDAEIVTGGSDERRKVLDNTLSQTDADYLNNLVQYNKVLSQRNALLKHFAEIGKTDLGLLNVYDEQLLVFGEKIHQKREVAFGAISPFFKMIYERLSGTGTEADSSYKSQLATADFKTLLKQNLQKELILERTEVGIHKDDIEFLLNGFPVKRFGSQGQQKSFMLAFKLAMFLYIKSVKGFSPILLVDDVFDKLDKTRSENLLHFFNSDVTAQVIFSHTKMQDFAELDFVAIHAI